MNDWERQREHLLVNHHQLCLLPTMTVGINQNGVVEQIGTLPKVTSMIV